MLVLAVIPARWGSTRFPGKPLHPILGKPLLQHVWERTRTAPRLGAAVVATDDERIARAAAGFGARVVLTSAEHPSGTDRAAEAVAVWERENPGAGPVSHVLNVQGDEPTVDPALLDRLAATLVADPALPMITAACPLRDPADLGNPNCVKVVLDENGDALFFSRSPLPCPVHLPSATEADLLSWPVRPLRHQGIYGYRRDFLAQFVRWPPSPLERAEKLEQLRALEHGARVRVLVTGEVSLGVDVPGDVARVEAALRVPAR